MHRKNEEPEGPRRPPVISPPLFAFFSHYFIYYLRRHFNAIRIDRQTPAPNLSGPTLLYMNHPSWWDPLVAAAIAIRFYPGYQHFAPIDADALERYRFMMKLGFFGVQRNSRRGTVHFLRTSRTILREHNAALWLTPEGDFTDPRNISVPLRPGIGHLAANIRPLTLIPMAIEYAFWQERLPEAFIRFGEPVLAHTSQDLLNQSTVPATAAHWTSHLADALRQQQLALTQNVISRDPARFTTLLAGRSGVGGMYDLARRMNAWRKGRVFFPGHEGPQT